VAETVGYQDAIRIARELIGTPYKALDCINLIKKVIRTAPGGVSNYTTAGTNTLWDSFHASAKYRDLTWRQEGLAGARAGMLAFKRYGADNEGHVGLVTGEGTVIHSSSENGRGVVETPLTAAQGWDLLAVHRYIGVDAEKETAPGTQEDKTQEEETQDAAAVVIVDSAGRTFFPQGDWRVLIGGVD